MEDDVPALKLPRGRTSENDFLTGFCSLFSAVALAVVELVEGAEFEEVLAIVGIVSEGRFVVGSVDPSAETLLLVELSGGSFSENPVLFFCPAVLPVNALDVAPELVVVVVVVVDEPVDPDVDGITLGVVRVALVPLDDVVGDDLAEEEGHVVVVVVEGVVVLVATGLTLGG